MEIRLRKPLALLVYLAVTGRPHSRDTLAEMFWPGYGSSDARANLRRGLSDLNRSLPNDWIESNRQTIALRQPSALWVDVADFRQLAKQRDEEPNLHDLERAIALYQGDFLAGFSLPDSPEFEAWQREKADVLTKEAAGVLDLLATTYASQGDSERALAHTRRRLGLDPFDESAHRALMRLYARSGQRAAALRQYEACALLLSEEMQLDPQPETTALWREIQADRVSAGQRAIDDDTHHAPRHPPRNLPAQTTPFIGRQTELAALARLLADPHQRLITILAPGGMGKTRLALATAAAEFARFPDGAFFVPLTAVESPSSLALAIAEAVGYTFQEDSRSLQHQLFDYLKRRKLLLVLDNFEHLLTGVDLIAELLQAAPAVRILVTSRQRLQLSGETVYRLEGMEVPQAEDEARGGNSALDLFVQRARQVQPGFEPTADDRQTIARICRMVGGIPLGIVLAAGWVDIFSPRQIAAELEQNLELLETDLHDVPARQRSMQAVLDQTWERLNETEQTTYMALSVFWQGFTYAAARVVAAANPAVLAGLANKGLLVCTSEGRYDLHELLRQYAASCLLSSPRHQTVHDAHAAYYLGVLASSEADLHGPRQQATLQEMMDERGNVRAAWQWARTNGQTDRLAPAVEALALFYFLRHRGVEGKEALESIANLLAAAGSEPLALARAFIWQGVFCQAFGQTKLADNLCRRSLQILDDLTEDGLDVRRESGFCLVVLGGLTWHVDIETARQQLEEGLALCQAVEDRWRSAFALRELGRTNMALGNYRRAHEQAQESLDIRRALGHRGDMTTSLAVLCWSALFLGWVDQARDYAQTRLAISREMESSAMISYALLDVAQVHLICGEYTDAQSVLGEARQMAATLDLRHHMSSLDLWLAETGVHLGRYEQAQRLAQNTLVVADEIGLRSHIGMALSWLGKVQLVHDGYAEATRLLADSARIFREIGQPFEEMPVYLLLGYAAQGSGDAERAWGYLHETLAWATRHEDAILLPWGLALAAHLYAATGEAEKAILYHTVVMGHPAVANSRWFHDVAGRELAAIAASLPPAVTAAAQERGKALDLRAAADELLVRVNLFTQAQNDPHTTTGNSP